MATVKSNDVVLRFTLEKETKNTFRYQEQPENGQPPRVGTLYVQKWAIPNAPATLTVTIVVN